MLGNHEKDKNTLITTKAKLKVVNKELEEMRWSHEVLQQKYNQVSQVVQPIPEQDCSLFKKSKGNFAAMTKGLRCAR